MATYSASDDAEKENTVATIMLRSQADEKQSGWFY